MHARTSATSFRTLPLLVAVLCIAALPTTLLLPACGQSMGASDAQRRNQVAKMPGNLVAANSLTDVTRGDPEQEHDAGLLDDAVWSVTSWSGNGSTQRAQETGSCVYQIESEGADMAWHTQVDVTPDTIYELSGWVRTESVTAGTGKGALLNVHDMPGAATSAVVGDRDWTQVSVVFNSGSHEQVQVNCLLGGWGEAAGRVSFRDISLVEVEDASGLGEIVIDAGATRPAMSELIYSQFIEHLGRCIYGGIWAEMLEDRKFYYPITGRYAPYLNDEMFPAVVRSPWERMGPADSVTMVSDDPFVGSQDPRISSGGGIRQHDLGIEAGQSYTGYIWIKSAEGEPTVTVTLAPSGDPVLIRPEVGEYKRYSFEFTASESTTDATLSVEVDGGAVRVGTLSLMPANHIDGMRADTLALMRQLRSPLYRWPGGNFVSGYDWRDGIGDRDRRPPRTNPAWTGVEHNDFGMHEFIRLCELLETEPLITINMGFEGLFSAEAQMEYANGGLDTRWGALRAANGSDAPFDVKYWCIGNEMYGDWQLGYMQPHHYQMKHNAVVDGLREEYPDFYAIASGYAGDWSLGLLENCADRMDFIAEHVYFQPRQNVTEHVNIATTLIREKAEFHRQAQATIPQLGDRRIPIAMTEWNYWYGPHPYGELGTVYYLRDALGIAAGLNEYSRCSDIIGAAFYAQTVNVIGCIKTTKTDAFLAMTALPLIMYREHFGTIPIELDTGNSAMFGLDIAAAWTEDRGAITVAVVNSNPEPALLDLELLNVEVVEECDRWWFSSEDPEITNTADSVRVEIQHADGVDVHRPVEVPGYSSTIFVLPVRNP